MYAVVGVVDDVMSHQYFLTPRASFLKFIHTSHSSHINELFAFELHSVALLEVEGH
jgi:hypothetical protein